MREENINVLLVEDNPGDVRLIEEYLTAKGDSMFIMDHVRSLQEARDFLDEQSVDLILLDLGLPGSQGVETFHTLHEHMPNIPILVLTGLDDEETALECVQAGAQDYLVKDHIDEFSLPKVVRYAVERFAIQEELQERERQLRNLMGNLEGMVYRCQNEPGWPMVFVSQGTKTLTGYDPAEISKDGEIQYGEIIHPEDRSRVWEEVQNAVREDRSFNVQYRIITKDGRVKWVWEEGNAIGERDDQVMLEGYISDITERVQSKKALEVSERRYRQLAETAQDYIVVHDIDGRITYINQAGMEFSGYTETEILGKSVSEFVVEEDLGTLKARRGKREKGNDHQHLYRTEFVNKEGDVVPVEVSSSPIASDGIVEAVLLVARDITERMEAQKKLEKSEMRYRTIFNATPVAIWEEDFSSVVDILNDLESQGVVDLRTYMDEHPAFISRVIQNIEIKDVNAETLTMFGAENKEELIGSLDRITTPRMQAFMRDLILAISCGETYFEGETVNRTLQGEEINVWLTVRIPPETQKMDEVLISMMDITGQKQAEKKYRNLYNSIRDAILIANTDREIIDCNPAFQEIFGYELDEIRGKQTEYVYENHEQYLEMGKEIGEHDSRENFLFTVNYRKKSGEVFPGETNVFHLKDEFGETIAIVGLIRDITDRKEAERALKESEERYRSLFESVPIGLYRTTPQGDLTDANQALIEILGYPDRESLLERNASDFYAHAREKRIWHALMDQEGEVRGYEAQFRCYDGSVIWVQDNTRAIYDAEGSLKAYQGSLEDITERKRGEQEIKKRSQQLQTLRKIGLRLTSELDVAELLDMIVARAVSLVRGEAGSFNRYIPGRGVLDLDVHMGYDTMPEDTSLKRGQGLIGKVWEAHETIRVDDYQRWQGHSSRWVEHFGSRACIGVPVMWGGELLGVLEILREEGRPFSESDARLLELFATQAAIAIHNAQLFEHAEQRLHRLQALREIDQTISGSLDLKTTLNVLVDRLINNLNVDAGSILLYEPGLQTLDYVTGLGFRSDAIPESELRIGEGQAGKAALERKTIHIPDLTLETVHFERAKLIRREGFISYFGVPLIAKGEIVGVLEVFHRELLEPDEEWINFLETLAGQAAIAIDRLNLFDNLERSNMELIRAYNEVIEGWARALELRDQETEGHSRRVEQLTLAMAREMGMKESEIADVRQGALLHDIGKMGVPDSILQKPGKLTEEEWDVMRKHPTFAYELLSPIEHLKPALDIPYCHHEKWDGSGYPQGLIGEEIPLAARIFAVVDVWDALRSDRPYRDAWSDVKALQYIKDESGTHFDPSVVKVFLDVVGEL